MRRFWEAAALQSLEEGKVDDFQRQAMAVVEMYGEWEETIGRSPVQGLLIGLFLFRLITSDQTPLFHSWLESFTQEDLEEPEVMEVLGWEGWMQLGNY